MYKKIKDLYDTGRIAVFEVRYAVAKDWITKEQADEILRNER
ncbi:MAG: XkdX family protein [Lachnospiraceae bacterium]|nr:XkdX family protein [Lachnospiraceae bacterium]